jgi:hypothetical protein
MGFLDKLRGGDDLTLGLDFEPAQAAPGDKITVRFDVGGELDDKARGVRVGLKGTGHYLVLDRDRDADGDIDYDEEWRTIELYDEEHHYPAQLGPGVAEFTLPADAAPSSPQAVSWQVSVRVDRERGMDKVERRDLTVRQPPDRMPQARAPHAADDGLKLEDVPVAVRAGDGLTGHLTVNVADEVKVSAVRIRLHRKRTYDATSHSDFSIFGETFLNLSSWGGSSRITKDEKKAEYDLSDKRTFAPGSAEQIPFAIAVPADAGPTTAHPHARVEWRLEAVLDRKLRGDLSVETPLIVY